MRTIHDIEIKNMLRMAQDALDRSYSPHTGTKMGVCLKGETGAYYLSGKLENADPNATVYADHAALCKAVYEGERKFDAIAIISEGMELPIPKGNSLKALCEFCDDEMPVIVANGARHEVYGFGEIKKGSNK